VLLDEFTETEIRGLCPKVISAASKQRSKDLSSFFTALAKLPPDAPEVPALIEQVKDSLLSLPDDTKGVRLDLEISLPSEKGTLEIWCDFTGIHPTSKGARAPLATFLRATRMSDSAASGVVLNNAMAREPSPAVVQATKVKMARYLTLMGLATTQVQKRMHTTLPKLVAGVITHLGELGPDMIGLIETLTSAAARQFRAGPLSRGLSRAKYTAIYRTKLKDALLCANASGFGQALVAAGNPMAGWVRQPDEWDLPCWDVNSY
jgi:hypothetical protein